jgi:hypothetical protein
MTTPSVVQHTEASKRVLSGLSTPELMLTETMPTTVQKADSGVVIPTAPKTVFTTTPVTVRPTITKDAQKTVETTQKQKTSRGERKISRGEQATTEPEPELNFTFKPYVKTNLSTAQFNKILDGTGLDGYGESYYRLEQKHDINGVYAMSVAFLESGYGKHLINRNNFYGMRGDGGWLSFDSPSENIAYFGKLMMRDCYTSKETISGIGTVYCPDPIEDWAGQVKGIMRRSYDKVS